MWAALASLALNKGKENRQEAEQNRMNEEQTRQAAEAQRTQNIEQGRIAAQQYDSTQLPGMQNAKQEAYARQQQVFDSIMQKYRIGGGGING